MHHRPGLGRTFGLPSSTELPCHTCGGQNAVRPPLFRGTRNFLVIALGLPVPPYPGTALDPPLRSRFAAKRVPGDVAASAVEKGRARTELLKRWKKPRAARAVRRVPSFLATKWVKQLLAVQFVFRRSGGNHETD